MGMLLHASRLLDWEKRAKSFKQKCLTLQGISLAAMAAALLRRFTGTAMVKKIWTA